MTGGCIGKILWVDLTKESMEEQELPEEMYKQHLGGYGLACRLIYEHTKPKYSPLGQDSILGFFPGLLTGTAAPLSGRYMVCGKSPLTGSWGDANSGGTFGPEIKKCGYDGILFKGIAKEPLYFSSVDGNNEILSASEIWGKDIIEAEELLQQKHGKFIKTAGIGKAGENVSLISGVANDKGRIAARCGVGAIMGSKKLKILVLKGKTKIPMIKKQIFLDNVKAYNKQEEKPAGFITKRIINMAPKMGKLLRKTGMSMDVAPWVLTKNLFMKFGTTTSNVISVETGDTPIKNWAGIGHLDFPTDLSDAINAPAIYKYRVRSYGCFACPVKCGAICKVPELGLEETHRPEYETCAAFGSNLLNNDLLSIFELNELCNRATIDVISAGATVAFAIECYQNGIITKDDTDGLELNWGDSKAIVELTKKIINREGIGDILADGTKKAAEKLGKGSEKFAIQSLGQEIAMHNPRVFRSLAFSYAFDPTPGRHTTPSLEFSEVGSITKMIKGAKMPKNYDEGINRAKAQVVISCYHQCLNSLGLCLFTSYYGPYPFFELINSLTDWNLGHKDITTIGHRIQTLRQSFAIREGVNIAKNELNGRIYGDPPFEKGPTKGITIEYKEFYKNYCKEMGWNPETGVPLKETLERLDLDFVIKDLY